MYYRRVKVRLMEIKGYYLNSVYMGYIPSIGKYWQFESETAYINYIREMEELL
jgi:hypothetical protein